MDSIKKVRELISRWYLLYLTSTEMYMVEPWERVVIHVMFGIVFVIFWYFNYSIMVNAISHFRVSPSDVHQITT